MQKGNQIALDEWSGPVPELPVAPYGHDAIAKNCAVRSSASPFFFYDLPE